MDAEPLSLCALGTLEARRGGRVLDLGSPLRRSLLALLLLAAPQPVTVPRLVDQLWPGEGPRDPVRNLQVHVSALRAALGANAVTTVGRAYRLDVDPARVDLCRFEANAAAARDLLDVGRHEDALRHARQALSLGGGTPGPTSGTCPRSSRQRPGSTSVRRRDRAVGVGAAGPGPAPGAGARAEEWVRR